MDTQQLTSNGVEPEATDTPITTDERSSPDRPTNVPEKFWDTTLGNIRTDALLKSYSELESRMGELPGDVPENPDQYDVVIDHQAFEVDTEINAKLHAAGFSQEQAQLVYDLAKEKLLPLMETMSGRLEHGVNEAKLKEHFGGQEKWRAMSRQIGNWGRKNLPPDAFNALASNHDGIIAIHRMMTSNEPTILGNQGHAVSGLNERDLKRMMHDPRYWRDQDPAFIDQVQQGFKTLYPG
jgi:hypothetical protein